MANSKLEIYSLGCAAEDIKEDDPYLLVHPIEILPTTTGNPNDLENSKSFTNNANGGVVSSNVNTSSNIRAKYMPWNDSNGFPPYICKGENVLLLRFGGSNEYYWISISNENSLRKVEKIIMMASNKRTPGQSDKNYYFLLDTINKCVRLHTDKTDGEACSYDVEFDTKKGIFTLIDSFKNEIELDSVNGKLTHNINKMVEENIGEDIKTTSGKTIERNTKQYTINTDGYNLNAKKGNVKAAGPFDIKLKTISIANDSHEIISILLELMDALLAETHVGNMGRPTPLTGESAAKYAAIKEKIQTFKN